MRTATERQNLRGEEIPTRPSLLVRLRNWDDEASWQTFFDTYWRLIYNSAKGAGLNDVEAEEVLQETVIAVAGSIPKFEYDREKGSFKSWLFGVTRNRILLRLRTLARDRRLIEPRRPRSSCATETSTSERVADPKGMDIERIWDQEWEVNLQDAALERVKRRVDLKHFQVFDLCLKGQSPGDIARGLKVRRTYVYLIRHRLKKLLQNEVQELLKHPLQRL